MLGAEIAGVDLARPLDDATFAAIERVYDEYGVVFFRRQSITPAQQLAFTRRFRKIEFNIVGEHCNVSGILSNITEGGRPTGAGRAGENWHRDVCYTARPPRGTVLYALEVLELHGLPLGDTDFASAAAAWDSLPDSMKRTLEERPAVFGFLGASGPFRQLGRKSTATRGFAIPSCGLLRRRVARASTQCATTAPASRAWSPTQEALIDALADHIVKPAFVYRHRWHPGDVLMCDNCMGQHRACPAPFDASHDHRSAVYA